MRVLVTGAAGFIGSHTAEHLLRRGDEVVGDAHFGDWGYQMGLLIGAVCDGRLAFLRTLSTWPRFGRGWGRRVEEVRKAALAMAAEPAALTISIPVTKCSTCGKALAA